jgi:hypothetical protein
MRHMTRVNCDSGLEVNKDVLLCTRSVHVIFNTDLVSFSLASYDSPFFFISGKKNVFCHIKLVLNLGMNRGCHDPSL